VDEEPLVMSTVAAKANHTDIIRKLFTSFSDATAVQELNASVRQLKATVEQLEIKLDIA